MLINNPPPRLGGKVRVIAEGRVNPGEVSRDGKSVVFGEFKPGVGESVFRWRDGETIKLNTDGFSSYQAHCNEDASVVTFHRYSLKDALDPEGNWDVARWEDGKIEVVGQTDSDEMSPDIDDSGNKIVFDRTNDDTKTASIVMWEEGKTRTLTESDAVDLFAEISGDGERVAFRRNLDDVHLHDQNGVVKPIKTEGSDPAGLTISKHGDKILYTARDEDGDQDLFLKDLRNNTTTVVSGIKGMDEYEGYLSGDGETVVFTGIDFRKEQGDMNVYVWKNGETKQLTWDDGGLNAKPSVSHDGNTIAWYWIDSENTANRKIMVWEKDQ